MRLALILGLVLTGILAFCFVFAPVFYATYILFRRIVLY